MPVKLIYHVPGAASRQVSPFDKAIIGMSDAKDIRLASPYLSLNYVRRVIEKCDSWRILTDVEEWIASQLPNARLEIKHFIESHCERVHHYRDLHAKVLIAGDCALLGSANFTEKGITQRIEMCALFEKTREVADLRDWFDRLWQMSAPVDSDELSSFILSAPNPVDPTIRDRLSSPAPGIDSTLLSSTKNSSAPIAKNSREAHDRLVERVRMGPSRQWISSYFDLINRLIEFCDVKNGDPRVCMSMPESQAKIQVNLNMRVVLNAWFGEGGPVTGFIFGSRVKLSPGLQKKGTLSFHEFKPHPGEDENDLPYYVSFPGMPTTILSDYFEREWKVAAVAEVQRRKGSPIRAQHQRLIYEAAVDLGYRRFVLDGAFPNKRKRG